MKRPIGVTVIAVLMFVGAAFLLLGSVGCFFVGVMNMTGADAAQPVSVAIVGMALAAGFSLLLLAGVYAALGIGVLQLCESARQLCMASFSLGVALTLVCVFVFILHPAALIIGSQFLVIAAYMGVLAYLVSPRVRLAFAPALATP